MRLATALRGVAYTTTSANVRNWSLTRALELDGSSNLERFRTHRFQKRELFVARRWNQWFAEGFAAAGARRRDGTTLRVIFTDGGDVSLTIATVWCAGQQPDGLTLSVASDHWFDMLPASSASTKR